MNTTRTSYRRARKFTPGSVLNDPCEIILALNAGRWIFFGDGRYQKVYHASWIANMNFSCVMSYLKGGKLRLAVRNPEYPYVFEATFMDGTVGNVTSEWWGSCSELPGRHIKEITKDALCSECEKWAVEATGRRNPRVQVTFKQPERVNIPVALLEDSAAMADIPF